MASDWIPKRSSWETPQTAQQICSFVGLCQAYSRHMKNFSKIAAPLTDLLKGCKTKRQRVTVEGKSLEAFYALQKLASEAPVLKIASWEEPFEVITDASNITIGAVLQQDSRPVAFYSKKLDSAQRNYSVYDKELFVIISALKHWKHFLYGRKFTVKTDHQALKWLQTMPSADWSDRQARWSQIFQQYGGMIALWEATSTLRKRLPRHHFGDKFLVHLVQNLDAQRWWAELA
ncbi:hypothetical protein L7F22_001084 [Adiantum nelumboides]|nr:hypothetical protein [Adiantum nelumboides]